MANNKTPEGFSRENFQFMIGTMMASVQELGRVTLEPEAFLELMQESAKLVVRSEILETIEAANPELVQGFRDDAMKKFGLESFETLDKPIEKSRIVVLN